MGGGPVVAPRGSWTGHSPHVARDVVVVPPHDRRDWGGGGKCECGYIDPHCGHLVEPFDDFLRLQVDDHMVQHERNVLHGERQLGVERSCRDQRLPGHLAERLFPLPRHLHSHLQWSGRIRFIIIRGTNRPAVGNTGRDVIRDPKHH